MKIEKMFIFLRKGTTEDIEVFAETTKDIEEAISFVVWPEKSNFFTINPQKKANGVKPIKKEFINHLNSKGWKTEHTFIIVDDIGAGPIDAIYQSSRGMIAAEWETGNVSSSHRAINKMALALVQNKIIGGILIVPVKNLAKYLTDRIGNYEELTPYFTLWSRLDIERGLLAIIGVNLDDTSLVVPFIPKGQDGNAKKQQKKVIKIRPSKPPKKADPL